GRTGAIEFLETPPRVVDRLAAHPRNARRIGDAPRLRKHRKEGPRPRRGPPILANAQPGHEGIFLNPLPSLLDPLPLAGGAARLASLLASRSGEGSITSA